MTNDLIERYIYAVTKRMTDKVREDVSEELRTLIDDMLDERCGEVMPAEKDIRIVLTELGNPQELYEKYGNDSKKCLIGSPYYSTYKFLLKIVLICVAFGMCVSGIVTQISSPSEIWYKGVVQWLGTMWSGLIFAFAFVTLLFAFFYQKDIKINDMSDLDDLPPVPQKNQQISKWESIFGIGATVVFLIVFLTAPQIFCVVTGEELIPVFNIETIRNTWYIIVLFGAAGIIRDSIKLIEGKYSRKVMVSSVITDIISAILSFWWLLNDRIINPEFAEKVTTLFAEDSNFIKNLFENFQYFFLLLILFALFLDAVTAIVKSVRK